MTSNPTPQDRAALPLYGIPCASCSTPAKSHNFETGQTFHVSFFKPPCQTQIPRR